MDYQYNPTGTGLVYGQDKLGAAVPTPKEPGIRDRLQETLKYLAELSEIQRSTRLQLVGPEPTQGLDNLNIKQAQEPSIEYLLVMVCQAAAISVSEAGALLSRL